MDKTIGQKIKLLRKKRKLTLKAIAEETNLSISFLSQVERMKSSLTLESLKKISEALQVNPSYFFSSGNEQSQLSVIRAIDNDEDFTLNQFIYKDLSSNKLNLGFNPILVILNSGENKGNPFTHHGSEFLYVLEGVLTVQINNEEYQLKPHDSIIIDSSNPHYWSNYTNTAVKFLCVSSD
ncbi:helix-turn-helix domain-containing protein [Sporosarcina limicola]|uniref:Transcriptional regulator with XRE-family HTH domain n=1 Tax=Sporosarcina limicola TaxID=34101 RepID=A0A927MHN1_9BACL|nr:XRE family transcriptional regulator [Sporosarcina limicola]MBE1553342.1 transcriptional regulator with XRE-family HTH domain [Sporosarcina limicola]